MEEGSISIVMEGSRQNYRTRREQERKAPTSLSSLLKSLANTFHWLKPMRRQVQGSPYDVIHRFRVSELSMGEKMNQREVRGKREKPVC